MSERQLRILLVAEGLLGTQAVKMLTKGPHKLVGLLASPSVDETNEYTLNAAQELGIPNWLTKEVESHEFSKIVTKLNVDLILDCNSPLALTNEIVKACRTGAFKIHPGPLPQYAGTNPQNWALYNGERHHGVTLYELTETTHAGPVAYESSFPIEDSDNGFSLSLKCDDAALALLIRLLDAAAIETPIGTSPIPCHSQAGSGKHRCEDNAPNAGRIDWDWRARDVVNHVRACDCFPLPSPWEAPITLLMGDPFGVSRATITGLRHAGENPGTVGAKTDSGVLVACADEWIEVRQLKIDEEFVDAVDVLSAGDVLSRAPVGSSRHPSGKLFGAEATDNTSSSEIPRRRYENRMKRKSERFSRAPGEKLTKSS